MLKDWQKNGSIFSGNLPKLKTDGFYVGALVFLIDSNAWNPTADAVGEGNV